jgi:hypothetical protein
MVYKSQKRQLYGDEENITLNKHITILSHIKKSCGGYNKIWHKIIKNMNLILNKFCHIYLFDGILHGSSKIKRIVLLSEFILWLFLFHEMLWFVELFPEHHVAILNFPLLSERVQGEETYHPSLFSCMSGEKSPNAGNFATSIQKVWSHWWRSELLSLDRRTLTLLLGVVGDLVKRQDNSLGYLQQGDPKKRQKDYLVNTTTVNELHTH